MVTTQIIYLFKIHACFFPKTVIYGTAQFKLDIRTRVLRSTVAVDIYDELTHELFASALQTMKI